MYLSKIEMTGFKSFADKTVIEFDRGLTAVVGPNGSGKSNLSEAVRWVLGEQSAKSLRGSRMEDVIFNGTQERKPVNIAKVSIILNNEDRYLDYDFSEVSLTRSYNRNGDSSYYINQEKVRLKDIVDLFLDSGLGKNSFSIISQGQVEQIFLNKPEERRAIFEEAAGVQKYQYRKMEAQRNLEKSRDHLSRVKDILHELNGQLKPLEEQRDRALIYKEKQAILQELEVSLYTYRIQQYQQEWQELEHKLSQIEEQKLDYQAQVDQLSRSIEKTKSAQQDLMQTMDQTTDAQSSLVQSIEQSKADQKILLKDIEHHQDRIQDIDQEKIQQIQRLEQLRERSNQLVHQEKEQRDQMETLKENISQLEAERQQFETLNLAEIEDIRNEIIGYYQEEANANNLIHQSRTTLERQSQRQAGIQERLKTAQDKLAQLNQEKQAAENQLDDLDQIRMDTRKHHHYLQEKLQECHQRKEKLSEEVFKFERESQRLQTRYHALYQAQEEYAGYYAGVRSIMKQRQSITGIVAPVADLIQVPVQYEKAIEVALGASIQHVVVENDLAARQAVEYLKTHKLGRATFLPRTNLKPRYLTEEFQMKVNQHPGYINLASNLIQYDSINGSIMLNLLGNTIVANNLASGQEIAKICQHRVKVVTLEGDVLMPGGSVTGGRHQNEQASVLSRQNDLEQAKIALEQAQVQMRTSESQYQELLAQIQKSSQEVETGYHDLTQAEEKYQKLSEQVQNLKQNYIQQQNQEYLLLDELEQVNHEINEAQEILACSQSTLEATQILLQEKKDLLAQHNLSKDQQESRLIELEGRIQELTTQVAVLAVELRQVQTQKQEVQNQIIQVDDLVEKLDHQQEKLHESMDSLQEQAEVLKDTVTDNYKLKDQYQEQIDQQRLQRQSYNDSMNTEESERDRLQQALQEIYQKASKFEAKIERNQTLVDNYLEHLNQEYQLTYELAKLQAKEIESVTNVNQQVKELRIEVQQLGPINLQAIDDFKELEERYQNLSEQEQDLLTAMAQLQETMDEMDQEVIRRFGGTFKEINQQFQQTFNKLFGGGEAYLSLTEPKDLLVTGIDIIAQPPGKKKQNLALLSGGERALTAIALLFAILEVKPVPFVILDEVEAALDDANVYRYGKYIKEFTEDTQFIVITHRKGTMEAADRLYGVTMERSGVSKLASVKLNDAPVSIS